MITVVNTVDKIVSVTFLNKYLFTKEKGFIFVKNTDYA